MHEEFGLARKVDIDDIVLMAADSIELWSFELTFQALRSILQKINSQYCLARMIQFTAQIDP